MTAGVRLVLVAAALALAAGCGPKERYGIEGRQKLGPGTRAQVWAVAPAVNLSGERGIDPLLQADILFGQLQRIRGRDGGAGEPDRSGVRGIGHHAHPRPGRRRPRVRRAADRRRGDPRGHGVRPIRPAEGRRVARAVPAPRRLAHPPPADPVAAGEAATPGPADALPPPGTPGLLQATGYFDAANGSVRTAVAEYAAGRFDPDGPTAGREFFLSTEKYCGWVYSRLLDDLLLEFRRATVVGE